MSNRHDNYQEFWTCFLLKGFGTFMIPLVINLLANQSISDKTLLINMAIITLWFIWDSENLITVAVFFLTGIFFLILAIFCEDMVTAKGLMVLFIGIIILVIYAIDLYQPLMNGCKKCFSFI